MDGADKSRNPSAAYGRDGEPMKPDQQNFTVKEAALLLSITERTLRRWIAEKKIRVVQVAAGHAIRIPRREVFK